MHINVNTCMCSECTWRREASTHEAECNYKRTYLRACTCMRDLSELRTAAARLRELAANTSGGTWAAEYLEQHNCWWVTHETEEPGWTTHGTIADLESAHMAGNASWIALMGPAVAEPLAAWLDSAAADVLDVDARALAFARVVNSHVSDEDDST